MANIKEFKPGALIYRTEYGYYPNGKTCAHAMSYPLELVEIQEHLIHCKYTDRSAGLEGKEDILEMNIYQEGWALWQEPIPVKATWLTRAITWLINLLYKVRDSTVSWRMPKWNIVQKCYKWAKAGGIVAIMLVMGCNYVQQGGTISRIELYGKTEEYPDEVMCLYIIKERPWPMDRFYAPCGVYKIGDKVQFYHTTDTVYIPVPSESHSEIK